MNIKSHIYNELTPKERIIASIDAMARGDEKEKQRLVKSCPKKSYTMNDPQFYIPMSAFADMIVAVECDMRGLAIKCISLLLSYNASDKPANKHSLLDDTDVLQEMLSIQKAWYEFLDEHGIEVNTLSKAYNHPEHYAVKHFINVGTRLGLEVNPDIVQKYKDTFSEYLHGE